LKLTSRIVVIAGGLALVGAFLAFAFWPRPVLVDFGAVERGPMSVTIDEEGKTRIKERYVVSAPITGRLLRLEIEPGDEVVGGETIVARMTPVLPAALDVRTEEQAKAAIEAAKAALSLARAEERRAKADAAYAEEELARARALFRSETIAKQALDRAEALRASAVAAREAAGAAVVMRAAELDRAEKTLIGPEDAGNQGASQPPPSDIIPIRAPVSGHVLQVFQKSEATLPAGASILEIGDPHTDLEILVELLSSDAVKVSAGDPVLIDKWGGEEILMGEVDRVEPLAFTKVSALGVEEQRVNTIIKLSDPRIDLERLGHGFRVEARIVIWSDDDALVVPTSALFRNNAGWAVYSAVDGRARLSPISVGRNNGVEAQIERGLSEGDTVILFPSGEIEDGTRIAPR
jgi:HlyD family secretion protein